MLLPWLLRWDPPADRTTFAAALHAGSCLGICWALRSDLRALDVATAARIAGSSAPAAAVGYLAADAVERRLGRPPQLASLLAGFGALMWTVDARQERRARDDRRCGGAAADPARRPMIARDTPGESPVIIDRPEVTAGQAALAGLAQVAALVPGVSRSGATLTALRAAGVDRAAAYRFSLLMSLPVTAGAAALTLSRADRTTRRAPGLPVGAAAAAAMSGVAAVRLLSCPTPSPAAPALYRLGLAALVARRLTRQGAA